MSPFRVQCETCQSRLLVRDPGLVGQIHGCPKCGGMVCLTPPAEWAEQTVETPATTTSAPTKPTATDFAPPEDLLSPPPEQPTAKLTPPATPAPDLPATEAAGGWALLAVAAGGITVLLGGVGLLVLRSDERPPEQPTAVAELQPSSSESEESINLAAEEVFQQDLDASANSLPAESAIEQSPTDAKPSLDLAESTTPDEDRTDPAPMQDSDRSMALPTPLPLPSEDDTQQIKQPETFDRELNEAPGDDLASTEPFDPLDFDPEGLALILTRGGSTTSSADSPATRETRDQQLAPQLVTSREQEFEPAPKEGVGKNLSKRLEKLAADARATVRRGPTGPPPEPPEDPLQVEIPELRIAEITLADALRLIGKIAGSPITLQPAALRTAGVAADTQVSLRGSNTTVGTLLEEILTPLRLEIDRQGSALVVSRIGSTQVRQATYRVSDLLPAGSPDALPLVQLLRPMLQLAGPSHTMTGDGRSITINGPGQLHLEFAVLCERLRQARGLPLASRYPEGLVQTEPLLQAMTAVLERRTTFTFAGFTPLAEVFAHWRSSTGLEILVDWASLADNDLLPTSTIACSVNDRPWRESLDAVLGGIDLVWMPVAPETLWITTTAAGRRATRVEFYPVASPDQAAQLIQQLSTADALRYDEPGKSVLALGNDTLHRKAAVALGED